MMLYYVYDMYTYIYIYKKDAFILQEHNTIRQ